MTKQHFEAFARWIAVNTNPGTAERESAMRMMLTLGPQFNPRFDAAKFIKRVGSFLGSHVPDPSPTARGRSL